MEGRAATSLLGWPRLTKLLTKREAPRSTKPVMLELSTHVGKKLLSSR